jgi:hypothetical protein
MTPVQSFLARFLGTIDAKGNGGPARSRGGLLGTLEALQMLIAEGVTRGWLAPTGGSAANPPTDADVKAAGYPALKAANAALLASTVQGLDNPTLLAVLYTARA